MSIAHVHAASIVRARIPCPWRDPRASPSIMMPWTSRDAWPCCITIGFVPVILKAHATGRLRPGLAARHTRDAIWHACGMGRAECGLLQVQLESSLCGREVRSLCLELTCLCWAEHTIQEICCHLHHASAQHPAIDLQSLLGLRAMPCQSALRLHTQMECSLLKSDSGP